MIPPQIGAFHARLPKGHNGMDFLLTWNFNHINNAIIKKGIARVAKKYGLECPIICSPEELIGE